jgi:hypothetical protein
MALSGFDRFIKLLKLVDADIAVRKAGHYFQISAHGLNDAP